MFSAAAGSSETAAGEEAKRAFGILEKTIREGQDAGDVRAGDSVALAQAVWAQVHGIGTLSLEPDLSEQGAGTRFVRLRPDLLLAGLHSA